MEQRPAIPVEIPYTNQIFKCRTCVNKATLGIQSWSRQRWLAVSEMTLNDPHLLVFTLLHNPLLLSLDWN